MSVADILRQKGTKVVTTRPDTTLHEAIKTLTSNFIGALLVTEEDDRIVGILTERDILRASVDHHEKLKTVPVSEIMTKDVLIGIPEDSLDYVMCIMTEKRIRHLPIISEGALAGLVSIGDVVKAKAEVQETEVRQLTDYITGKYPG